MREWLTAFAIGVDLGPRGKTLRSTQCGEALERFAELTSPEELLRKLKHGRRRIREDYHDAYAAFDFFATAYHLLDWRYPDPNGAPRRKALRDAEPLLQIADHIANGAKHFVLTNKRHNSVASVEDKSGAFSAEAFSSAFSASALLSMACT